MEAKDRIIVALDVDSLDKAKSLVENLAPHVGCFKVGLELLTSVGAPKVVEFVHSLGGQVFYDGKFNDIPNTVGGAARAVAGLNVKMFNVHASAGIEAMMAAVANKGQSLVLAVTVLTSLEENNAHLIFGGPSKAKVLQLARDAKLAGCDGIICSPQELELLGKQKELGGLMKITPGIRSSDDPPDDQKRTLPPGEAIGKGANFLVIGRPITNAPDPVEAAKKFAEEMSLGLKERFHTVLFDLQKIKFGAFRLKLHEKHPEAPLSPIYLNIRDLPEWVYTLAGDLLHDLIVREGVGDFDYVIGIPKAGESIGHALAKAVGRPLLRIEKIEADGSRRITSNILDSFERGKKVVLVDDLITKAETKREAVESIEANGLQVVATVVLYDRQQGGLEELNRAGRKACAVSRLDEALDFFVHEKRIPLAKKEEVIAYITAN
ncbi:MAG: orotidine 5-phosphate decarboxylase orotate phosphoribosyltransferase [Parcubacteria group bacterium Licking1014_1]|nr:MAG: orotidine 5-phosphate decarboxylase orotate phosphoribosyltransferase [Parcubacteria group bacterium Licking1014_1]